MDDGSWYVELVIFDRLKKKNLLDNELDEHRIIRIIEEWMWNELVWVSLYWDSCMAIFVRCTVPFKVLSRIAGIGWRSQAHGAVCSRRRGKVDRRRVIGAITRSWASAQRALYSRYRDHRGISHSRAST